MWGAVLNSIGRGAAAVGRGASFLAKGTIANMRAAPGRPVPAEFNPGYWGVRGFLNKTVGSGTATNISQNDLGVYALSQILDREFSRITSAEAKVEDASSPLSDVPEVTGDNIPYVIRVLDRNIYVVDQKVQAVARNVRKTEDLLNYAKRTLERTNSLLESNARASSAQRFKDLENQMEAAQSIAAIDQKVQAEVEAQVAAAELRLRQELGNQGGLLESILGLFTKNVSGPGALRSSAGKLGLFKGVLAGAAVAAPTAALASLPPNSSVDDFYAKAQEENAFSRFLGGSEDKNTADYQDLMKRIDDSKTDRATVVSTDLYSLTARAAFFNAESLSFNSKRSLDLTSDGTVTVFSKQEIVLDAPIIKLNGLVITSNQMISPEQADASEGGVTPTTPDDNRPGWVPPAKNKPSNPDGVTPLNGDETINAVEGADRVSEAFRYFKSKGWTDEQAAAIVGNYQQESGKSIDFTNNTGDGGNAFGAAQWNRQGSPDRYANFKKLYGKDLTEATWEEQMEFTHWELTSNDPNNRLQKRAGDMLKKSTNARDGALIISQFYERPNPAFAHNDARMDYADDVMKNRDKYIAQDKENPILTKVKKAEDTFQGEAPEGYHTGMAPIKMTNQGAVRSYDIDPELKAKLQESVYTTYGPGYSIEVYSGGQDEAGRRKLDSSTRHNIDEHGHGQAADVYVIDPDGNRVTGTKLGKLGQYWQAKDYGGTGLEMHGGGIHLDGHTDRARTWNYGGGETKEAKAAVQAGIKGQLPEDLHYIKDEKPSWIDGPQSAGATRSITGEKMPVADTGVDPYKLDPAEQARVDAMYAGIYPVAQSNNVGETIASTPVVMPEDLPAKPMPENARVPTWTPSKKRKNTHDGVNMSASDLLASSNAVD